MRFFSLGNFGWLLLVGAVLSMMITTLDFASGFDQSIFYLAGQALLEKGDIYNEVFDFKPPPIFFIYASSIAIFGDHTFSPRALEAAFMLITAASFLATGRLLGAFRIGLLAFAVYYLFVFDSTYWNMAQVETFIAPFFGLGLLCLTKGLKAERAFSVYFVLCAGFFVVPALMKPTLGGFLPAAFVAAVICCRAWTSLTALAKLIGAFASGSLAFTIAILGGAELFGATSQYLSLITQSLDFYASGAEGFVASMRQAIRHGTLQFLQLSVGLLLPLLFLPKERLHRAVLVFLLLGFLIQIVGVAMQGRNFLYHYQGAVIAASFLTGWGIWLAGVRIAPHLNRFQGILLLLILFVGFSNLLNKSLYQVLVRVERVATGAEEPIPGSERWPVDDWQAEADTITAELSLNDEPVLIWAHAGPFLYFYGRENFAPASRIISSTYLRIMPDDTPFHRQMMSDLAETRPRVILVARSDDGLELDSSIVTSDVHIETAFQALKDFIAEDYEPAKDVLDYAVYLRKAEQ